MARWQDVMGERDREIYSKAGYCQRQPFGRNPALLIIDVTLGFIGTKLEDVLQSIEESRTSCGSSGWAVLPSIKQLLDACREKGMCVVYTRGDLSTKYLIGTPTKAGPRPENPEVGLKRQEIPELVAPCAGEWILEKSRASAFFATPLATYLRMKGVDSVVVTGCVTSGCIRASVVDAFSHGFRVFVVEDCVFDRGELSHLVNLYEMNAKYADVITLAEALAYVRELGEEARLPGPV